MASLVPSGCTMIFQPRRWMQTWWWNQQYSFTSSSRPDHLLAGRDTPSTYIDNSTTSICIVICSPRLFV